MHCAAGKLQVVFVHFKLMGCEGDGLGTHLVRGKLYRRARRDRDAAGDGRDAEWEFRGIGGFNRYVFELNAEHVCGNLRKGRAMALALAGCAGGNDNLAARRYANGRPFERPEPRIFDTGCDAQSAQLAAAFRFVASRQEIPRVDLVENEIQCADIIATIIGDR